MGLKRKEKFMRDKRIFKMTITSLFIALIAILALVPNIGFIPFGPYSITMVFIPVLVGALLFKTRMGVVLAIVFGICSLIVAFIRPSGPVDVVFQNPLVSILPRAIFGLSIYPIYKIFNKVIKLEFISIPISCFLAVVIHSVLTVSCMYIFGKEVIIEMVGSSNIFSVFAFFIGSAGIIEATASALIVTPIVITLNKLPQINE